MALYCNLCKTYKTLLLLPSFVLAKYIHKNIENRNVVLEVDAIDDFTTQLIQKQSSKWENIQVKSKLYKQRKSTSKTFIAVETANIELDSWSGAVERNDLKNILKLVKYCVTNDTAPPRDFVIAATRILAENGESEAILQIKRLCETYFPDILRLNAHFDIFMAEALWNQGNTSKSLCLFSDIYNNNKAFYGQLNATLKYLFVNTIQNRGEAFLLMVIKFCENLHKTQQDVFLLPFVWQMCFLSEWFTDQNVAFDLIEQNSQLRKVILLRVPFLVTLALNNHQTDVVYRLLEFLLKHELKIEYSTVLQCLFDYKSTFCCCFLLLC